jgi:dimethylargininase
MFTKALVRPPAPNFAEGLTTSGLGAPDYQRALAQHKAYCAALERCGLTLTRLEADSDYPDSTFVEDTAVIAERCAVLINPRAPSRAGEVASIRRVLADLFPAISEIQSPGTLDGGDVCEAGNHFFIGVSSRTNEAGAQQLAELLAQHGYTTTLVDIRTPDAMKSEPGADRGPQAGSPLGVVDATGSGLDILHLKSGLAYLGDNRLVVIDALANRAEFSGCDLIRMNSDEEYAANCVRVNDQVLVAAGYPRFEGRLRELGYQTIALEMTEFQKMDGGLSCLSLRF